jgi:small redox-active disulfide protein 2
VAVSSIASARTGTLHAANGIAGRKFPGEPNVKMIKILGTGCANCQNTLKLVKDVAKEKGIEIQLEKVEDVKKIMAFGVMSTPSVVIDGKLVHAGGVPARAKVEGWF